MVLRKKGSSWSVVLPSAQDFSTTAYFDIDIMGRIKEFFVVGTILYFVGCLAASLALTYKKPAVRPTPT